MNLVDDPFNRVQVVDAVAEGPLELAGGVFDDAREVTRRRGAIRRREVIIFSGSRRQAPSQAPLNCCPPGWLLALPPVSSLPANGAFAAKCYGGPAKLHGAYRSTEQTVPEHFPADPDLLAAVVRQVFPGARI